MDDEESRAYMFRVVSGCCATIKLTKRLVKTMVIKSITGQGEYCRVRQQAGAADS